MQKNVGGILMADRVLLNYVEQVYTLECEQYTLTQMINILKSECLKKKNQLQVEQIIENSDYTKEINSELEGGEKISVVLGVIVILLTIFIFIYGLSVYEEYSDSSNTFSFTATGMMLLIGIALYKFGINMRDSRVQSAYNKKDEAYKHAQSQLNDIKKHNSEIRIACAKIENNINELEGMQSSKKSALQYMYDYDIIHKSYRNFYGISKIYHLLDTGICTSLTGVNGAYSQMRTDQIIDNQKISIELQKSLLATNHMMYNAITKTNDLLGTMNQQMNMQNASNTRIWQDIRNDVKISNFLLQSGNDDRKALTVSAEYIAYAEKQKRLSEGNLY